MSKTISLDELPPKLERLRQSAWDEYESVFLERNGEPVAAVVSLDEYRRLQADIIKAERGAVVRRHQ
ncbi:MAG: type II toxin-antitoxin system prevent-host-death family antitoxin [Armatimonadetes bacterium]|nr:type II toxin-antitoxin system prevent-host-death family antitoxin [Armatimonadota bacterium]